MCGIAIRAASPTSTSRPAWKRVAFPAKIAWIDGFFVDSINDAIPGSIRSRASRTRDDSKSVRSLPGGTDHSCATPSRSVRHEERSAEGTFRYHIQFTTRSPCNDGIT